MLFKIMIALAAYYVGRSGMGLEEFLALMERLIEADESK
jgi:hypothetical protein